MARHIEGGRPRTASERWAIEFLVERLPEQNLLISNIDITDSRGHRLELDALLIGEWAIYVLEFKGWTGRIVAEEQVWDVGSGRVQRSPLIITSHKARVLAGRLQDRITGSMRVPWCQGVVFVTGAGGEGVELLRKEHAGQVAGPDDIVERLTDPDFVGSRYRDRITPDQRDFAIRILGGIGRLSQVANRLQRFRLDPPVVSNGPFEIRFATYSYGNFERRFLMRIVDRSADSDGALASVFEQRLVDEFRLLQELSGVAGIPYAAPLIEEDERLALAIAVPDGQMMSSIDPTDLSLQRRIGLLRSLARVLRDIHIRGRVHGALTPNAVVVSQQDEIQLLDFAVAGNDVNEHSAPEVRRGEEHAPASDVWSLASMLRTWFVQSVPGDEGKVASVGAWLESALAESPDERATLAELFDRLRAVEERHRSSTAESGDEPFHLEEGAVLRGNYRLETELGETAAGPTWRAVHLRGRYPVALQFTAGPQGDVNALRERFAEMASIQHPLIARAFDLRKVPGDDLFYMVAEWLDGPALSDLIEGTESIAHITSLAWFRDLLSALEALHLEEISHGNVCPDAIVIAADRPRLVEFSLTSEETPRSAVLPSASPESDGVNIGSAADLYGLAASFIYLWSGEAPVSSTGASRGADRLLEGLPSDLPDALHAGIKRLIRERDVPRPGEYLEFFGVDAVEEPMKQLPEAFRSEWGISEGHQERVARFLIEEFHGNPKAKARQRNQVVRGSLALTDVRANKTLRNAANSAISALIGKGVIEKPKKRGGAVRPCPSLVKSWIDFNCK